MKRTCMLIFLLMIILLLCGGCWDSRELDELAIVSAIGFDRSENGYEVTLQIVNPGEVTDKAQGYDTPVTIYTDTGKTVMESMRKLTTQMPRKAYISHLRIVVFGEELARSGFSDVLDFLSRDHEMRSDFYIMVSKGKKAKDVIGVLAGLEIVPANKLYHSLKMSENSYGSTLVVTIDDLVSSLLSKGRQPVLTALEVIGSVQEGQTENNVATTDEPTLLKYNGIAAFNQDRLIGWLSDEESKSYNFIQEKIRSTVIDIPCEKGTIGIEVFRAKSKIKGDVINNKPIINIDVMLTGNIADVECDVDLSNLEEFNNLILEAQKVMKQDIEHVIEKAQHDFKVDIFGFGEAIHRASPKAWKEMSDHWNKEFENLTVHVKVDASIKHMSTLRESLRQSMRE